MEFFAVKIREGQFQKGGRKCQSPIESLMELYAEKIKVKLETGENVLHFDYLISRWCSLEVYLFYHLIKKYEIEIKKTFK